VDRVPWLLLTHSKGASGIATVEDFINAFKAFKARLSLRR
jgi:hypothetical protein